jgi:hypothetical protein
VLNQANYAKKSSYTQKCKAVDRLQARTLTVRLLKKLPAPIRADAQSFFQADRGLKMAKTGGFKWYFLFSVPRLVLEREQIAILFGSHSNFLLFWSCFLKFRRFDFWGFGVNSVIIKFSCLRLSTYI